MFAGVGAGQPASRHTRTIASLVSNLGSFMHIAAAGWAMTDLTTSTALVGLVQTAWGVPGFLPALHAGAFADLFDRRRLIIVTEALALVIAGSLAVLDWAGGLTSDLLLLGTFLESLAITASVPPTEPMRCSTISSP